MLRNGVVVFFALSLVASAVGAGSAAPYVLTDLGTLGGTTGAAYGVNNSGWVTGWADLTSATVPRAFLATPSGSGPYGAYSMIDVSTLAGFASNVNVGGYSINNSGAMVGFALYPSPPRNGFIYSGGPNGGSGDVTFLSNLPGVFNGYTNCWPFGINSSGQIAGGAGNKAFFYDGSATSQPTDLNGGLSNAYAINDNGVIVGNREGFGIDAGNHPFYSINGGPLQPIFPGDAAYGITFGINNANTAVGVVGQALTGPNDVARSGADSTAVGSYRNLGQAFVATWNGSSYTTAILPSLGDGTKDGAFGISTAGTPWASQSTWRLSPQRAGAPGPQRT